MAENHIYSFARVSKSEGMDTDRQVHKFKEWEKRTGRTITKHYEEHISGTVKLEDRTELNAMIDRLRAGDTVVIDELSRLSRRAKDLEYIFRVITEEKQSYIVILNEKESMLSTNLDNPNDLMSQTIRKIMLTLLSSMAEMEREKISSRTKDKAEAHKKAGKHWGRPIATMPDNFKPLYTKACDQSNDYTHTQAMKELGLKKTTYYKLAKQL